MPLFSDTASSAIAQIDAEIACLQDRIHDLRVRRNGLVPVNRILPRDILRGIMHQVKWEASSGGDGDFGYGWIRVGQVCGYWREVALESTTLWTTLVVPPASVPLVEEFLKRSKETPLSLVRITGQVGRPQGIFPQERHVLTPDEYLRLGSLLQDHLQRINQLSFDVNSSRLAKEFWSGFRGSADCLEQLTLKNSLEYTDLPPGILARTPNLRQLHLERFKVDWNAAPFLNERLQELHISIPSVQMQVDQLEQLLLHLPNLRTLQLDYALANAPPVVDWDNVILGEGPIQVESLRTLTIKETRSDNIAHLLSQIHFHDSLRLRLHFEDTRMLAYLPKIATTVFTSNPALSHLESGFGLSVKSHSFRAGGGGPSAVTFTFSEPAPNNNQVWFELGSATIDYSRLERTCAGIFAAANELVPMENARECTIGGIVGMNKEMFTKLSRGMNLETVALEGCNDATPLFMGELVDGIPQCATHKQVGKCMTSFDNDKEDEGSSGISSLDDEEDENSSSAVSTNQDKVGPGNQISTIKALTRGVHRCEDCEILGRSFFPVLRSLVFRDVDLRGWWTVKKNEDPTKSRMHPVAEFIVRRIRCGLRVEEIVFEESPKDWPLSEETIRKQLRELCGDLAPLIKVRPMRGTEVGERGKTRQ